MDAAGTTMIARTTPTSPAAEMATALGDLAVERELPSMVGHETWKARTHAARGAGSEYLNVQFGWIPLVSDLRDFAYAVKHRNKIIGDYRKGSDKKIRRRYVMTDEENSYSAVTGMNVNGSLPGGTGTAMSQTTKKVWFSGAYRYHIPMGNDMASRLARYDKYADKLLGVNITPEVIWNISPWSWAADWFGNTGDVMHNISALGPDGLVLQYGYAMSSRTRTTSLYGQYDCQ